MIKEIKSSEAKQFFQDNSNSVLLDVRTENEWQTEGKPKTSEFNLKTHFITVSYDLSNWQEADPSFVEKVKKEIKKDNQILVMCAAGGRSMIAAKLLNEAGFVAHNLSDGYNGNGQDPGWKNAGLPTE